MPTQTDGSLIDMILDRLSDEKTEMPAFPVVAQEILSTLQDQDCSIQDLESIVRKDQVIAGKLVQLSNSSFYRGLKDVEALPDAIMRLGFKEVRNVALAVAMKNAYQGKHARYTREMNRLWRHSIGSAFTAREVAKAARYFNGEEAFLAGLVHDIGCVFVVSQLDQMAWTDERVANLNADLFQQLLGRLHEEVGNRILEQWAFPDVMKDAVAHHHEPKKAAQGERLAWILNATDLLVRKLGLDGSDPDGTLSLTNVAPMQALDLGDLEIAKLQVILEDRTREMVGSLR